MKQCFEPKRGKGVFNLIEYTQGNLFDDPAEAYVNAVNTVGIMGKGIAAEFKARYPANFRFYAAACETGEIRTGEIFATKVCQASERRWIINFPTKRHWRDPSQLPWISAGLVDLRRFLEQFYIQSVAIPALGAGNGGIPWIDVKTEIEKVFQDSNKRIAVYLPHEPSRKNWGNRR